MDAVTTFESSFESNGTGTVQRLDVIPAGPARRRWTAEAKARIISESLVPGANVSAVARRHGLVPQQVYAGRRKVGERIEAGDAAAFVPAMMTDVPSLARCAAIKEQKAASPPMRRSLSNLNERRPNGSMCAHLRSHSHER